MPSAPLDQDAAPVQRIILAPDEIEFHQAIKPSGDGRLRNVQLLGQAADGLRLVFQIANQEDRELTG